VAGSDRTASLTGAAVAGASWMFATTVLGRLVGFAGQFAMGWLLRPEDFGVWALALSMATAVTALRNGGTTQILIQRGTGYYAEAPFFQRYSLIFNMAAFAILATLALLNIHTHYALAAVLFGIAASMPFATPAMLYRAKLTVERRFRDVALITLGAGIAWQGGVVTLAAAGAGALSFAAAPVLQSLFETIAGRAYAGPLPRSGQPRPLGDYVALFKQSSWGMMSAAVLSLATTGNYFAVAMFSDARTVGLYYFGFQTVVSLSMPIYTGIEAVLPTLLTSLESERSRQMAALGRAMRAVMVASVPMAVALVMIAPLAIHILWRGKWDMAVPITQAFAVCIPAWLIIHTGRSLLEARGYWRLRFVVQCLYGVGGIVFAAVGTLTGGVDWIAVPAAAFYVVFAIGFVLLLGGYGLGMRHLAAIVLGPIALSGTALALAMLAVRLAPISVSGTGHTVSELGLFLLLAGLGNLIFFRSLWSELLGNLLTRLWRKTAGGADRITVA
jgi:lipopolysaccharide exporter